MILKTTISVIESMMRALEIIYRIANYRKIYKALAFRQYSFVRYPIIEFNIETYVSVIQTALTASY